MVVLVCEDVTKSQRGEITKWMIEVKSGVFIGNVSFKVREKLWNTIVYNWGIKSLLLFSFNNEQGFDIKFNNYDGKKVINLDGIVLTNI